MTPQEYFDCAKDLLVAVEALRRIKNRMGDFAVGPTEAAWNCLEAIWKQLWEGFDAEHPGEENPLSGPSWELPATDSGAP